MPYPEPIPRLDELLALMKKTDKISLSFVEDIAIEMSVNKKDNTFSISIPTHDLELSGGLEKKGDTLVVTPDLINLGFISLKTPNFTITIKGNDKMPAPLKKDKVKTVFEIPADVLEDIFYDFEIEEPNDSDLGGSSDNSSGFFGEDDYWT